MLLQYEANHIDVASSYGDAELRIAPWLARYRSQFYVATKADARTAQEAKAGRRLMAAYGRSSINRDATVDHRFIEWAPQVGRPGLPAIHRAARAA